VRQELARSNWRISTALIVFSGLMSGWTDRVVGARELEKPPVPDLTQGGKKDDSHDWLLGPTGARGWMFFRHEDLTAASRQILITAVEAGSPADGVLIKGDVILGVADKPFSDDARKSFGRAIAAAEETNGVLRLIRWREGQSTNVDLKLSVLGAYSNTAPYDCPKSKKIFEQGCQFIAKNGLENADIPIDLDALALLASGDKQYHPLLADYARKVAASLRLPATWMWYYAYGNLFLAEYVLATGDQSILPELIKAIEEMAPSDEMFADGIRLAGLDLLSRLHIREGMHLCVSTIEWRWGNEFQKRLEFLTRYGVHAKEVLPQLRKKRPEWPDGAKAIDTCIADIEAGKNAPTLVSLKDFIARASSGSNDMKKGTP
jgi:hypothetical protein